MRKSLNTQNSLKTDLRRESIETIFMRKVNDVTFSVINLTIM